MKLYSIGVENFKGIRKLEPLELTNLNCVIGDVGSGKSSLISACSILQEIQIQNFQRYSSKNVKTPNLIYSGCENPENIAVIDATLLKTSYQFEISMNSFGFDIKKSVATQENKSFSGTPRSLETDLFKSDVILKNTFDIQTVLPLGVNVNKVEQYEGSEQDFLYYDLRNLAPYLERFKDEYPHRYEQFRFLISSVKPSFKDFLITHKDDQYEINFLDEFHGVCNLRYLSKMIRQFVGLLLIFLRPRDLMPDTLIIDGCDFGFPDKNLEIIASIISQASEEGTQIIMSASSRLMDFLPMDSLIMSQSVGGQSFYKRLNENDWVDYEELPSELLERNILDFMSHN